MEGQLGLMSQNRNAIAKVEPDKTTKEPESPVGTERLMDVSNVKQPLNQPNRRVRTRTHGGVGRLGPRGPGLPRCVPVMNDNLEVKVLCPVGRNEGQANARVYPSHREVSPEGSV